MVIKYPVNDYQAVYSKYLEYRAAKAKAENRLPLLWMFITILRLIASGVVVLIALKYVMWIISNYTHVSLQLGPLKLSAISAICFFIIGAIFIIYILSVIFNGIRNKLWPEFKKAEDYEDACKKIRKLLPYYAYSTEIKTLSNAEPSVLIERDFSKKAEIVVNGELVLMADVDGVTKQYRFEHDMYSFEGNATEPFVDLSRLDSKLSEIENACPVTIKLEAAEQP